MERDSLLPKAKASSPYGSLNKESDIVNGNCQGRQNTYGSGSSSLYGATKPAIVQTGGIFNTQRVLIDNGIQVCPSVPSNYSGYAWLSLLFCCFPLSIAAIYKSDKTIKSIRRGDFEEAWLHSEAAKKLSALAIIYGILIIMAAIIMYFVISTEVTHTL